MENLISNHWNIVRNRLYDPETLLKVSFMILAILVLSYVPFKNLNFWNFEQTFELKISFGALAHVFLLTFWTPVQKPLNYWQIAQLELNTSFGALAHVFLLTFWKPAQKPHDYWQSARFFLTACTTRPGFSTSIYICNIVNMWYGQCVCILIFHISCCMVNMWSDLDTLMRTNYILYISWELWWWMK